MPTSRLLAAERPYALAEGRIEQFEPAVPPVPAADGRRVWRLQVDAGAVWLTWPGGADDVFLVAGESVEVPAGRRVLVEVEPRLRRGAAVLRLLAPCGRPTEARHRFGLFEWVRRRLWV